MLLVFIATIDSIAIILLQMPIRFWGRKPPGVGDKVDTQSEDGRFTSTSRLVFESDVVVMGCGVLWCAGCL